MRGRPFSRSLAHALGFAVMLAAPPATALGIEFEPLSELFVDANDTSIDTLGLPIVGPFVDSHTVSADGATSSASYDFSDERLRIEFDTT